MPNSIEVLAVQDCDGNHDFTVFIDGRQAQPGEFTLEHVDPGRGWTQQSWDAQVANIEQADLSPAFRDAVLEAHAAASDSTHIGG